MSRHCRGSQSSVGIHSVGLLHLSDEGQQMTVTHRACPLPAALQLDAEVVGGYLEGAYAFWLQAAGSARARFDPTAADGVPMSMVFTLMAESFA